MAEIYPVVHVNKPEVALEMANMALSYGADGVFLINHNSGEEAKLIKAYNQVTEQNPNSFIGLNFLERSSSLMAFLYLQNAHNRSEIERLPDALWVDDAYKHRQETLDFKEKHPLLKTIKYFGGIAFKYTDFYTDDPKQAAWQVRRYCNFVDVVTTSGQGTGHPPSIEKIAAMKAAAKSCNIPLAVASGVSVGNINSYNGNIDKVLVSTSIETEPYSGIFVPAKLKEIIELSDTD